MFAGDETDSWSDAGPCPACGAADCWLACPDAEIDTDAQDDAHEMLCGCDYCNMVGQPCWRARSGHSYADKVTATIELSPGLRHATASILAAATGLPLLDACHRTTTTTSACEVDHLEVDLVEI